jgi:hypothetical protein
VVWRVHPVSANTGHLGRLLWEFDSPRRFFVFSSSLAEERYSPMTTRNEYIANNLKGFMQVNPEYSEDEARAELREIWYECNGDVDSADVSDAFTFDTN